MNNSRADQIHEYYFFIFHYNYIYIHYSKNSHANSVTFLSVPTYSKKYKLFLNVFAECLVRQGKGEGAVGVAAQPGGGEIRPLRAAQTTEI